MSSTKTTKPRPTKPRIYAVSFASVYPLYVKKAEAKGRTKAEVDQVCGVRVEDIEDRTMRRLRYLDKLIDELAKGKPMDKILRA